jgi:hypothetical protein
MTDIVTGTVAHFKEDANHPDRPPKYDPITSRIGVMANVPDGTDDGTAEVAIFASYFNVFVNQLGPNPLDQNTKDILEDATKGLVQVIDLRRTHIPSIK